MGNRNIDGKYGDPKYKRIVYGILILSFLLVTSKFGYNVYNDFILKEKGICTDAIIYKKEITVGRVVGKVMLSYKFIWDDITYEGSYFPPYDSKQVFSIGDTISVVFLEDSPQINRSNVIIKKECGCTESDSINLARISKRSIKNILNNISIF